jgi:adenylylsulfate kinase
MNPERLYLHPPRERVTRAQREALNGHRGAVLWFTGLSGAGKSTLAHLLEERLFKAGVHVRVLDGDNVRRGLCSDLDFSTAGRHENLRRIAEMCKLFADTGMVVLAAFISPLRADREQSRAIIGELDFMEVHCDCPLAVCEARDVKGLYRRARAGEIPEFTGISAPYEVPEHPALALDTSRQDEGACLSALLALLRERGIIALEHARSHE